MGDAPEVVPRDTRCARQVHGLELARRKASPGQDRGNVTIEATATGNGAPETYASLLPGTDACYEILPNENRRLEPETRQVYELDLRIRGDETPLDRAPVYFVIPPPTTRMGLL